MNIGYLDNGVLPGAPSVVSAVGGGLPVSARVADFGEEMTPLPRPASAGAAAVIAASQQCNGPASSSAPEDTVLYDYPPLAGLHHVKPASSRHRGVNLRKQHSVSCASHCCENQPQV